MQSRGSELRQFRYDSGVVTCGAFAQDSAFAVTGTQSQQVMIWPMPSDREIDSKLHARVSLIENVLEGGAMQVRIWAEFEENRPWLLPGASATVVFTPEAPPSR